MGISDALGELEVVGPDRIGVLRDKLSEAGGARRVGGDLGAQNIDANWSAWVEDVVELVQLDWILLAVIAYGGKVDGMGFNNSSRDDMVTHDLQPGQSA